MSMSAFDKLKGMVSTTLVERIVRTVESGDERKLANLFDLLSKLAPARYFREGFAQLAQMARENHPFVGVFRRVFTELNESCRKKAILNFMVNFIILGRAIRERKEQELGIHIPNFMVISPTMRCNLHCKGCYASAYSKEDDLPLEVVDRVIREGKELGMYFYTFSGGECFVRPELLDLWEKHDDCYFQVYTNGTLLDEALTDRLARMGNVAPMVSVEGSKEETDYRRGPGTYEKVMEVFDRLRRKGILYGFSATFTKSSAQSILKDEFIERMLDKGCKVGWFFQYIPTGNKPDLDYMATPEQRAALHEKVEEWRNKYPIFLGDFWNDGPYVDGCMAGGQRYLHIISSGDVEPCVFVHFAVDNIKEKSLVDVLQSDFFKAIREAQPYEDDNLLCPCLIIDHPQVLRELVERYGARPTHPGSEALLKDLAPGLDRYSERIKSIYGPLWEKEGREKYLKSFEKEDDKRVWERARKHAKVK
ncbi:Radical SAM domain protein [Thermovirga lienii DSM 17291]|uniref:Radical SAM domain protein n=1 Tax=Thermovirga lienii (strain ATCC BAA-1197 / DSM 17291 / Cas60314) TaxID=580340 RepID=G7V8Q8_THELD|nr:radical SAM protein [Thermovirga lienii]AER66349.1 Radical SAM domain protein [Thermovirga lienii DSM 17291]